MNSYKKYIYRFITVIIICANCQTALTQTNLPSQELHEFERYISNDTKINVNDFLIVRSDIALPESVPIIRSLSFNTKIIAAKELYKLEGLKEKIIVANANDEWKLSPSFDDPKISKRYNSYTFSVLDYNALDSILDSSPTRIKLLRKNAGLKIATVSTTLDFILERILPLPSVVFIDILFKATPEVIAIGYDRTFHGINLLDFTQPLANGKGITVGIKENKFDKTDLDLIKREKSSTIEAGSVSEHATVIATLVGGAGNIYYDGRGIANNCTFFSSSFSNLFADDAGILQQNNVTVQNHSYGTVIQSFYGEEARSYDDLTWKNKNLLTVFSSGNSGSGFSGTGKYSQLPGFANITGNFKMAKNVFVVGAMANTGELENLSSLGPAYDGRVLPQLVALGPNGTSDASAIVSGTAAVLQQVFKDSNANQLPSASLVKVLMINTADDIGLKGIDHKSGYGLLNSEKAVVNLQRKNYKEGIVTSTNNYSTVLSIPANAASVKITLCWTDTASQVNNDKAIINDLDLSLVQQSNGTVFLPWLLSTFPNKDSLVKPAIRAIDSINTTEQITLEQPQAGLYSINVKRRNNLSNAIPFSIAYLIDTLNTFRFIAPVHQIEVDRAERQTATISWDTHVADTNTIGNLSITYNGGSSWNNVQSGIKIYKNRYSWIIPDTISIIQFRMQTAFGTFVSKPVLLHPVSKINVDFYCADSLGLSWKVNGFANAYDLYAYADSPYLKKIITLSDTSIIIKRSQYPFNVFAVKPVLANGIDAARSIATDVNFTGVNCFYKTFNAFLSQDNRISLELNLSIANFVDSVYFEKISSQGIVIKNIAAFKANSINLSYQTFDLPETNGIHYYRVKMRLKNAGYIYTDVECIITSGKEFVIFYPNPVSGNTPINLVIKEGQIDAAKLMLIGSDGKMLKYYDVLPNSIRTESLPRTVIFYKLFNAANAVIQSGQFVITR